MRAILVSLAALLGLSAAVALAVPQAQDPKSDRDRIVGTWKVTRWYDGQQDYPPEVCALVRLTFTKDGQMVMSALNKEDKIRFAIPAAGHIDLTKPDTTRADGGIYKFDGDERLWLSLPAAGGERPKDFDRSKDKNQWVLQLQRAKPGEERVTPEEFAKYKDSVDKIKLGAARAQSQSNLKVLGLAMQAYHDVYKAFPARAIYDKDGKTPLLSWRVAVLPYMGQQDLFNQFRLNEPWDSEHNKKLVPKMPAVFEDPTKKRVGEGKTYYQIITGPNTVFQGNQQMSIAMITDGASNTVLVVEAKEPVVWTQPTDVVLPLAKDRVPETGGLFKDGTNAVFCDGSVRLLPRDLKAADLRALITPAGGENFRLD